MHLAPNNRFVLAELQPFTSIETETVLASCKVVQIRCAKLSLIFTSMIATYFEAVSLR